MSINVAFVCGHLGRDAELRNLTDGRQSAQKNAAMAEIAKVGAAK